MRRGQKANMLGSPLLLMNNQLADRYVCDAYTYRSGELYTSKELLIARDKRNKGRAQKSLPDDETEKKMLTWYEQAKGKCGAN